MTYSVVVTQKAKDDLRYYYALAAENAPDTAGRWLNRFEDALQTLAENPLRCPLAPENELVKAPIHQMFFGKKSGRFRTLFTVEHDRVVILHIRRGTMDKATEGDMFG